MVKKGPDIQLPWRRHEFFLEVKDKGEAEIPCVHNLNFFNQEIMSKFRQFFEWVKLQLAQVLCVLTTDIKTFQIFMYIKIQTSVCVCVCFNTDQPGTFLFGWGTQELRKPPPLSSKASLFVFKTMQYILKKSCLN